MTCHKRKFVFYSGLNAFLFLLLSCVLPVQAKEQQTKSKFLEKSQSMEVYCLNIPTNHDDPKSVIDERQACSDAVGYLQLVSLDGDGPALRTLGWFYGQGISVVAKNKALSAEFYRRAADAGDVEAMADYAWILSTGDGIDRDLQRAMSYAFKPAYVFNLKAQIVLANGYLERDEVDRAVAWREIACVNGLSLDSDDNFYNILKQGQFNKKIAIEIIKNLHQRHPYVVDTADVGHLGSCLLEPQEISSLRDR